MWNSKNWDVTERALLALLNNEYNWLYLFVSPIHRRDRRIESRESKKVINTTSIQGGKARMEHMLCCCISSPCQKVARFGERYDLHLPRLRRLQRIQFQPPQAPRHLANFPSMFDFALLDEVKFPSQPDQATQYPPSRRSEQSCKERRHCEKGNALSEERKIVLREQWGNHVLEEASLTPRQPDSVPIAQGRYGLKNGRIHAGGQLNKPNNNLRLTSPISRSRSPWRKNSSVTLFVHSLCRSNFLAVWPATSTCQGGAGGYARAEQEIKGEGDTHPNRLTP